MNIIVGMYLKALKKMRYMKNMLQAIYMTSAVEIVKCSQFVRVGALQIGFYMEINLHARHRRALLRNW